MSRWNMIVRLLTVTVGVFCFGIEVKLLAKEIRPPVEATKPIIDAERTTASDVTGIRGSGEVAREEQVRFEQDKAQAHMRELEDRMFRLAELIRELQPDDSARLLIGVRRAREQLIVEQMHQASELVAKLDLVTASVEQKEIIGKLEELKRLLLTADLDLELKLEQLRKVRDAREKLEKLIAREQQQQNQTESLAKALPKNPAAALESLHSGEKANKRMSEDLEQTAKRMGPSAASATGALSGASKCMGGACNSLGQSKPGEAKDQQKDALDKLAQARQEMQKLEEKLRKEVESLARQRVMEYLTKMIAQQRQVRETTEKLASRVAEKQKQAVLAVRQLAPAENAISELCKEAIELVETTQFSVVLPTALDQVDSQMISVADRLREGQANDEVIADEKRIEADLQALLDAMKDASAPSSGKSGQCKGCKGNQNTLLAEVKMLRWMQTGVHKDTKKVDELKGQGKISAETLAEDSAKLARRQETLREMTNKLHSKTCPHCLEGGE